VTQEEATLTEAAIGAVAIHEDTESERDGRHHVYEVPDGHGGLRKIETWDPKIRFVLGSPH